MSKSISHFFFLLLFTSSSLSFANAHYFHTATQAQQVLSKQLSLYTRSFTYLEIVESEPLWALDIARTYSESSIIILVVRSDSDRLLSRLKLEQTENVVVLHPKTFGLYELEILGLCESIDQLVVADLSAYFGDQWLQCIDVASRIAPDSMIQVMSLNAPLGSRRTHASLMRTGGLTKAVYDFVSCEGVGDELGEHVPVEWATYESATDKAVGNKHSCDGLDARELMTSVGRDGCLSFWRSEHRAKKGIMLGCWPTDPLDIQAIRLPDKPLYTVTSTYDTKMLSKLTREKPQMMVPGINLKTFVMLRGVWPEDDVLIDKIGSFETSIMHNDLVESNLIISGKNIIPIDGDDLRWCGDLSLCITRVLSLFKDRLRMDDPRAALKRLETYGCITLEAAQKHQQMIRECFPEAAHSGTILSSTWIGVKPMSSST